MHPQRTDFDIRPQSELLDLAADWHTSTREALTEIRAEVRAGQRTSAAVAGGVVLVVAAMVAGVFLLIGWALGAGLSWLGDLAGGAIASVWDQVLHPVLAAPVDDWFAAHAVVFGFDPTVVMWVWLGLGGFLLLTGSLRSPAGVAMFVSWLGWAAATTAIVHTAAAPEASLLSAGTAGAAALVASFLPIGKTPIRTVPVTPRETRAREEISEQTAALTAAREVGDQQRVDRIQQDMRDRLAELYPEPKPDGYHRAETHQHRREHQAELPVLAAAVLSGAVLITGMVGWNLATVVIAVLAAAALVAFLARPSEDEAYASKLQREREDEEHREAGAAVLREAEATLRSVPFNGENDKE